MKIIQKIIISIIKLIFNGALPSSCLVCRKRSNQPVCVKCVNKLSHISPPICEKCGQSLKTFSKNGNKCAKCYINSGDIYYTYARSVCVYSKLSQKIVTNLKYNNEIQYAVCIAELMSSRFRDILVNADIVIPVSMHISAIEARQYNQCCLIIKEIAKIIDIKYDFMAVVKTKKTKKQMTLTAEQRETNLRNAFKVRRFGSIHTSKTIVIIDDVCTTGSTFNEMSRAIRRENKEAEIICLSFAKTELN